MVQQESKRGREDQLSKTPLLLNPPIAPLDLDRAIILLLPSLKVGKQWGRETRKKREEQKNGAGRFLPLSAH